MILQALVDYYEELARQNRIARPGWAPVKVSYALDIDDSGQLLQVVSLKTEQMRGKKMALVPQEIELPQPVKRTVGVSANFLCDNGAYLLGIDNKGKPERTRLCYDAARALHLNLLSNVDTSAARAVVAFFEQWQPDLAAQHPAIAESLEEILNGANLIFTYDGAYVHEDAAICTAWQNAYNDNADSSCMPCLVTGEILPVATLHPSIKGVTGAQSSGASLISFNAPSLCSYRKEQGQNAPTSQYAAFAYGTALNHLLADRQHVCHLGDTTMVYWAQNGDSRTQDAFDCLVLGQAGYDDQSLRGMAEDMRNGRPFDFDKAQIDPGQPFYILGLAPNAARLSVRFFLQNSFGGFLRCIQQHHQRLQIATPNETEFQTLAVWQLLAETVNRNSRDKAPAPELAGEVLRATLTDAHYPATLLNGVTLRIRADREINWRRAAIIKAYYLKNLQPNDSMREVLTVALNENSTDVAYNLGRLFSVLEAIQSAANPGINATIRDKYFNSASATPAVVFPTLVNLAQKHLKKLKEGQSIYYGKLLGTVMDKLTDGYPNRMSLKQQGAFQLGYYHQTTVRYTKKEDEHHV